MRERKHNEISTIGLQYGFTAGVKTAVPIMIGYIPMAIAYGMISVQSGIGAFETFGMSLLVYAGASQFMAVNMVLAGAGGMEIVLAALVLNLRHFIMSMSVLQNLTYIPARWKAGLAFGMTDETFALYSLKSDESGAKPEKTYIAGLFAAAYGSWVFGTIAGILLSNVIPPKVSEGMAITLYAMFIGLLVPAVRKEWRYGVIAAASMLLCTTFGLFLSKGWAIVMATILGGLLGAFLKEEGKG